jgi:hypothetical protein
MSDQLMNMLFQKYPIETDTQEPESFKDPVIDLHDILHAISPTELRDALNTISEIEYVISEQSGINAVMADHAIGKLYVTADRTWSEDSATDMLLFSLHLADIHFNNRASLNSYNTKYPTLQLCESGGLLHCRMMQTLRGGRTLENLLWSAIQFFHDAERLHKDITIYS